jgi:putative membrane protein
MAQHMVLTLVAPPLLLLAKPLDVLLAGLPLATARVLARVLRSPAVRTLTHPVIAWTAFVAALWAAHFSPLYQAALVDERIHALEHALFFGTALAFWAVVLGAIPRPVPLAYPARALFLFLAMPFSAFLGLAVYSARSVLYAHYASHPDALADQQMGGELMWIGGGLLMFAAFIGVMLAWASAERRAAEASDAA